MDKRTVEGKTIMSNCERCGAAAARLYEVGQKNDEDEIILKQVCWSCDHDVINGGDLFLDAGEILLDRAESDYEFDPINCERPY